MWVPHSQIPEPLWLRAQDNPPSSKALAQLQVRCLMKQQQQIPAFISPVLRDICCIIFDMSGADHQSAPLLPCLLPLQQHGLFSTPNEVQSVNGGCVQTWPCPRSLPHWLYLQVFNRQLMMYCLRRGERDGWDAGKPHRVQNRVHCGSSQSTCADEKRPKPMWGTHVKYIVL